MGRLSGFSYGDVAKKLRKLGFEIDRQCQGSHELWRQVDTGRKVTVPNHKGDIAEGTLRAIVRETGLSVDQFLDV